MSWDDLEPGQDDLVKDDSARNRFRRAIKNAKPGISDQEALYTDHKAGDPRSRPVKIPANQRYGGPIDGGIRERFHRAWGSFRSAWDEAMQDALARQEERRQRKGK